MTAQLQKKQTFLKYCDSENNDDTKNALSGILANDLKFPSIYSIERTRQRNVTHSTVKVLQRFGPILSRGTIFTSKVTGLSYEALINK